MVAGWQGTRAAGLVAGLHGAVASPYGTPETSSSSPLVNHGKDWDDGNERDVATKPASEAPASFLLNFRKSVPYRYAYTVSGRRRQRQR